jgi:hypothetical protein
MDDVYYLLLLAFSLIIVGIYLYFKIKYGFWISQPVFHIYNLNYMFFPPGIINHSLPERNKYCNFDNIQTSLYSATPKLQLHYFSHLIRSHYLSSNIADNTYSPKEDNIAPYFRGHNSGAYLSLYYAVNYYTHSQKNDAIKDRKVVGAITSRPLGVIITKDSVTKRAANFEIYYVEYLCVSKNERKKGIAPQLIQTHYYNQSHLLHAPFVALFKREDDLTGIVPLCIYSTYGFSVRRWRKPADLMQGYCIVEIHEQNLHLLVDFIKLTRENFDIVIQAEVGNIIELLKTNNIYIYCVVQHKEIISAYFYRKTCVEIEQGLEVLSTFASICLKTVDKTIFVQGFKASFWEIAAKDKFGFCAIENISDNNVIIQNLSLKTKPMIVSPTAYYFYNFAYPTFLPEKCLIIL